MRTRNIKIATIFLLVLVLAPVYYLFSFQIHQQSIRHRMKEELECKILHSITLYSDKIQWAVKGKEIVVDGKLFDVKSIVYTGKGTAIVTGLFDEEETALVAELQKNHKENNSQGTRQLAQFFQLLLVMPEYPQENNSISILLSSKRFAVIESAPVAAFKTILTPPPQA